MDVDDIAITAEAAATIASPKSFISQTALIRHPVDLPKYSTMAQRQLARDHMRLKFHEQSRAALTQSPLLTRLVKSMPMPKDMGSPSVSGTLPPQDPSLSTAHQLSSTSLIESQGLSSLTAHGNASMSSLGTQAHRLQDTNNGSKRGVILKSDGSKSENSDHAQTIQGESEMPRNTWTESHLLSVLSGEFPSSETQIPSLHFPVVILPCLPVLIVVGNRHVYE